MAISRVRRVKRQRIQGSQTADASIIRTGVTNQNGMNTLSRERDAYRLKLKFPHARERCDGSVAEVYSVQRPRRRAGFLPPFALGVLFAPIAMLRVPGQTSTEINRFAES